MNHHRVKSHILPTIRLEKAKSAQMRTNSFESFAREVTHNFWPRWPFTKTLTRSRWRIQFKAKWAETCGTRAWQSLNAFRTVLLTLPTWFTRRCKVWEHFLFQGSFSLMRFHSRFSNLKGLGTKEKKLMRLLISRSNVSSHFWGLEIGTTFFSIAFLLWWFRWTSKKSSWSTRKSTTGACTMQSNQSWVAISKSSCSPSSEGTRRTCSP